MKKVIVSLMLMSLVCCLSGCSDSSNSNNTNNTNNTESATSEAAETKNEEQMIEEESSEKLSADEIINLSEDLDLKKFEDDCEKNILNAIDTYDGNYYKCTMLASEVRSDEVWFTYSTQDGFSSMFIEFPTDVLKQLISGEYYTVAGQLSVSDFDTTFADAVIVELQ